MYYKLRVPKQLVYQKESQGAVCSTLAMAKHNKKKVFSALKRKQVTKSGIYLTGRAYSGMPRSWPESAMQKRRKGTSTTTATKLTLDQSKQH